MKKIFTKKTLMALTILSLLGFGAYAFADWGMGPGTMGGWGHYGPGWHHGGWNGSGYGPMAGNLNDKDLSQLNKARSEFFNATEGLRQDLYAKQLEMRKINPNIGRGFMGGYGMGYGPGYGPGSGGYCWR